MNDNIFSLNTDITILLSLVDSNKFNKIKFLKKCLDSLKTQTFTNFEFIIFDNINNYEISSLINNYVFAKYAFINYTNPVDALNIGFEKSNSKYITFINYNYHFEPEYLKYLKLSIETSEKCEFVFSSHEIISKRKITTHSNKYSPIDLIFNFPGIISFLFKKTIINKIGYLDNNINGAENFDYFIRMILKNPNYLTIDYTLTRLEINSEDKDNFNYYELEKKISYKLLNTKIEEYFPFIQNNDNSSIYSYAYYNLGITILNSKKKSFYDILFSKIPEFFHKSYEYDKNNLCLLINFYYICNKLNIDCNNYNNNSQTYNSSMIDNLPTNLIEIKKNKDYFVKLEKYFDNQEIILNKLLKTNYNTINIKNFQFILSDDLHYLNNFFLNTYNLKDYNSFDDTCIFIGFDNNIKKQLLIHKGKKIFLWIDKSFDYLINDYINNNLTFFKTYTHITNNKYIYEKLININIKPFLFELNIFSFKNSLFKYNLQSKKILIYNGLKENNITNNIIYNTHLIECILDKLDNYQIIYTNDLDISYENSDNLIDIKCLIKFTNHNNHYLLFDYFNYLKIPI